MADNPVLNLNLVDVYGESLNEDVDIILQHQDLSGIKRIRKLVNGPFNIRGLSGAPLGRYRIDIEPLSYRAVAKVLNMKASGTTDFEANFPINPRKVKSVKFPRFDELSAELQALLDNSDGVLGFEGKKGQVLYNALAKDDIRRAGLLNIAAKTERTRLAGGSTILSRIGKLRELRGDRFFATVPQQLREDVKNSVSGGLFKAVSGLLHHKPLGYSAAGSFKTDDRYGNLQLTFFAGNNDWVADIDIDDAAGIQHVFQVVGNALSGQPTHPFNIHEVLVGFQHIDPGYSFNT